MPRFLSLPFFGPIFGAMILCAMVLQISPVAAEGIPPEALQQQYDACIQKIGGSGDGISMASKENYCACVRDSIASKWDETKVAGMAKDSQAQGHVSELDMNEIDAIGRDCVMKTLK
jgi:hypothetical protein